ncbi:putative RNase toxin 15 of polymorphic toxin system [Acinetobacter calcoaceticus]|uniref:Putative RNase toxin 15 of polymorphic toxin system n=1 Tax=Acinetobacter calcoaceticus TaxID=471 RepID=A0A4R1XIK2_ACICA|nr:putative RNase toxin 15 of polymorphic toxin system [Acinetobacter calcoaceticus]
MDEMAALHDPDQIAGGANKIGYKAFGLKNTNSSLGGQWPSCVGDLDAAVAKVPANERSNTGMNAKLERCKK